MKKEEMSFTDAAESYEMVGYVSGYVAAENEWGELFIAERPEEFCFPGEQIESKGMVPISSLPAAQQKIFNDSFRWKEGKESSANETI